MSTPNFTAQDASQLTTVRVYTEFDPYTFAVDNRPIGDLDLNIKAVATGSADAGRRAVLLTQLALNNLTAGILPVVTPGYFTGLQVSNPSTNNVSIGAGAWLIKDGINVGNATSVVKQAMLLAPVSFSLTTAVAALTVGQSVNFLIQVKFQYLDGTTMGSSALPFVDATNAYLPGTLQVGELIVSIKTGAAATTGSQTTPAADAGYTPLYALTSAYGSTAPTVALAPGSPVTNKIVHTIVPAYPVTGSASTVTINGNILPLFQESGTQSIIANIPLAATTLNPYAPIKLNLSFASTVANNNVAFRMTYLALGDSNLTSASATTGTLEALAASGTIASVVTRTTSTAVIPVSAFADYSNSVWSVTKKKLLVLLTRVPGDALDTNTGDVTLIEAVATQ